MKTLILFLVLTTLLSFHSKDVKSSGKISKKNLRNFIENQATHVIYPTYIKMNQTAVALNNEIINQCSSPENFSFEPLKPLYVDYIKAFHFSEAFQVGRVQRGAGEIAERLYAHPHINLIKVDIEVARYANSNTIEFDKIANAMGLGALDYLLFETSLQNDCLTCGQPLLQSWNNLPDLQKITSRCAYMKFVSQQLVNDTTSLVQSWTPQAGKFERSESFTTDIISLKEFTVKSAKAFGFLAKQLKDDRVGIPSGFLSERCGSTSCPGDSEHITSGLSILSLIQSLKGSLVFLNASSFDADYNPTANHYGFNQILALKGQPAIGVDMTAKIKNAIQNLSKNLDSNIFEMTQGYRKEDCKASTSQNRNIEICSLYQDIKQVSDLYKNQFLNAVDLGKPSSETAEAD